MRKTFQRHQEQVKEASRKLAKGKLWLSEPIVFRDEIINLVVKSVKTGYHLHARLLA